MFKNINVLENRIPSPLLDILVDDGISGNKIFPH